MTVLSPSPDDQMTSGRQTAGSTAGRSPTASTPAQYRKVFHRYQLRTKKTHVKIYFLARSDREKKPHQKITLLTALKAQKKPVIKSMFQDTSKNRKKSVNTADPRAP